MAKRTYGKRSFLLIPAEVIAGKTANHGYQPVSEIQSLAAVRWIYRRLLSTSAATKRKWNIYDTLRSGGGIGHSSWPGIEPGRAFERLHYLFCKLANPKAHQNFVRFAKKYLGYRNLVTAIRVPIRIPSNDPFTWLGNLRGTRLKKSPNKYHRNAVWLSDGILFLNSQATRWKITIHYSYRHDDSSWAVGLEQKSGEKFEAFAARAWLWLEPQIQWRNSADWYERFCVDAKGMKRSELEASHRAELQMAEYKDGLNGVFLWGKNCPGSWEDQLAEKLLFDADPQYRTMEKIEMTGSRLVTLKRWIRQDRHSKRKRTANK